MADSLEAAMAAENKTFRPDERLTDEELKILRSINEIKLILQHILDTIAETPKETTDDDETIDINAIGRALVRAAVNNLHSVRKYGSRVIITAAFQASYYPTSINGLETLIDDELPDILKRYKRLNAAGGAGAGGAGGAGAAAPAGGAGGGSAVGGRRRKNKGRKTRSKSRQNRNRSRQTRRS
jgi:hypothetical protein